MVDREELMRVGEAAVATGVSAHTLRYYERAGLLSEVPRTDSGCRRYGRRELMSVEFITRLRATGMPIARILAYADLVRAGGGNEAERLEVLLAHHDAVRRGLAEHQRHLDAIGVKIELYRAHLAAAGHPVVPAHPTPLPASGQPT